MAEIVSTSQTLKDGRIVVVRTADVQDAASMIDCFAACLSDGEGLVSTVNERQETQEERSKTIENFQKAPFDLLIVAECNGEIIGTLDFKMQRRKRLSHNGDFGISIRPQWRSCGLGSRLLSALINWAQLKPQVEKISLRVLASNVRAINLYRKYGFVEEGRCAREVRYENGEYEDELLMARFL